MQDYARKIVLPRFTLSRTCGKASSDAHLRTIPEQITGKSESYYYHPINGYNSYKENRYNLMPVVVDANGRPWDMANIYILSRITETTKPNMASYSGIADDLAAFKRFLENEDIDYKQFPKRKLLRPTYRYRGFLHQVIDSAEIAPTTARRRMSSVIAFYRWMIDERLIRPENKPWDERDVYIKFSDSRGFGISRKVKSPDISISIAKQNDPYDGCIEDGGKLRPLHPKEQNTLVEALIEIGHTEMTLIHLFSLFTGARIQSVLTLKVKHVRPALPDDVSDVRLQIGPGTDIDSKNNKQQVIHVPRWLYDKLRTYSYSERAITRRMKAGLDTDKQYLFLTNRGSPYYRSQNERQTYDETFNIRHDKNGQSVRQFIKERVIKTVEKNTGKSFKYRFHDLRASFGMNITEAQLSLIEKGETTLNKARLFVKSRMGHESTATTDLYLDFRNKLALIESTQAKYENYLADIIAIIDE